MDQNTQNQLLVQGGIDTMKDLVDDLIQKNMNYRGTIYVLKQQIADLTPKEEKKPDAA